MSDYYIAGLLVGAIMATPVVLTASSFEVNQVVNAKMWEASEDICKDNGGVLEVVADSFRWAAYCGNGVSKELSIK